MNCGTKLRAPNEDKRIFGRRTVLWRGEILANGRLSECRVRNISSGGVQLAAIPDLTPGTRVILSIERMGEIQARIVWKKDRTAGLEFSVPAS